MRPCTYEVIVYLLWHQYGKVWSAGQQPAGSWYYPEEQGEYCDCVITCHSFSFSWGKGELSVLQLIKTPSVFHPLDIKQDQRRFIYSQPWTNTEEKLLEFLSSVIFFKQLWICFIWNFIFRNDIKIVDSKALLTHFLSGKWTWASAISTSDKKKSKIFLQNIFLVQATFFPLK